MRAASARAPRKAKAKSVIMVFNCGGPSHIDLWDPKPEAPEDVRGTFRPIKTNVSGIRVTELLPRVAKLADKYSIIRSVHHRHQGHNSAMYWSIVGRPYPIDSTLINPSRTDLPSLGTLVGWLAQRDHFSGSIPPYVITPEPHCDSTRYITPGQYGGCLGAKFDPFVLNGDPNRADFEIKDVNLVGGVPVKRLEERQSLLRELDGSALRIDTAAAREFEICQAKAMSIVASGEMQRAFDLSREPEKVRERYGRHTWGQSHLLSRRLVEAGVPFVTTVNGQSIIWDTHLDNFNRMKDRLVPPMEQAFSALIEDLSQRGLLETTLVIWMGDFGRTPHINKDAGRDHWPSCYSVVMAGGGIRGGQVIGESDAIGGQPASQPVTPADIHATVLTALGYDPHGLTFMTADGRPQPLSEGEVIKGLL
ncbi:MAG: DUF1501 domain-containing protein [Planctomycetes bacterium]|nr:DUF1501 domain-containing protein [Planctomycetota bacterium]